MLGTFTGPVDCAAFPRTYLTNNIIRIIMRNSVRTAIHLTIFMMGFSVSIATSAQSLYRCGNVYQDTPCAGKEQGKEVRVTRPADTAKSANSGIDGQCAERGTKAQKIVWAREGGATQDKMMAAAHTPEQRKLVMDVYNKRGTSNEVRSEIEAECVAEKEKAARLAALLGGADQQKQDTSSTKSEKQPAQPSQETSSRSSSADTDAKKKRLCDALQSERENLISKQRAGGSASEQDALNQQKRDVDSKLRANQC